MALDDATLAEPSPLDTDEIPVVVVEPRSGPADTYDALYAQFLRAFKSNRRIFHALNR